MGPLVQAGLSNPSSKYSYQALQQSYPFSAKPRYLRTVSPSTEAEDTEIFERTPGGYNSDPLLASTRSPSFAHGVQHEKRNNYECSYCGKIFNRPSSLKVNIYNLWVLVQSPNAIIDTLKQPHWRKACVYRILNLTPRF